MVNKFLAMHSESHVDLELLLRLFGYRPQVCCEKRPLIHPADLYFVNHLYIVSCHVERGRSTYVNRSSRFDYSATGHKSAAKNDR